MSLLRLINQQGLALCKLQLPYILRRLAEGNRLGTRQGWTFGVAPAGFSRLRNPFWLNESKTSSANKLPDLFY